MSNLTLESEHGYVALTVALTVFVHNFYMSFRVGGARKKFGVKYPAMYATGDKPADNQFNCTQRGHQNSLESLPSFLALLLLVGLRFPVTAAASAVVYNAGKVVYFNGYASGDPEKRLRGAFSYLGFFTLIGAAIRMGIELLSS
mmetsp:Transcript_7360/g.18913  ORF Transcript_7360/g.18913 Transcript_7360/m.18913 type:complete len:144 (+) Transcript_7360:2119-2550(+)